MSEDMRAEHTASSGSLRVYKSTSKFSLEYKDADTPSAISISDVILQLRHIVGLDRLDGFSAINADNDESGDVGISDVIQNLRVIVGLSDHPKVEFTDRAGVREFSSENVPDVLYALVSGDVDLSWTPPEIL